jgi:hypothetical protein
MSKDFERLADALLEIARRIYMAGVEAERQRILAALPLPGYGEMAPRVKEALDELSVEYKSGVSVSQIAQHLKSGDPRKYERVRAAVRDALQSMTRRGEVRVVRPGVFLPPKSDANPAASLPETPEAT